jgi:putative tryptophan/tyrosine transport system substrate-binding protein
MIKYIARRDFIILLGGATAARPVAARAQQSERVRRLAALMGGDEGDPAMKDRFAVFRGALAEAGWVDGRNLRLDVRWAAGDPERIGIFAKELIDLQPDVIFVSTPAATKAVQGRTRIIPIVFIGVGDPVAGGLLENVAKPEGNTTGITNYLPSFGGKWLELLKEAAPRLKVVALVFNPDISTGAYFAPLEAAASQAAVALARIPYRDAADLVRGIDSFATSPGGGLIILPPYPVSSNRALINRLAAEHRLPTIYGIREYALEGGLMSYGPDPREQYRSSVSYVDRILRGAKVAELPVQFPTRFELVVNLKTAKAMSLMIPEAFLLRTDELIE